MKNFRKVLALILVVATLFSFAAMTSAKEYKDADKISYDEAVEVLTAIGILNGYDDGSFKPTDNIAREEMAKMVAVLSNAGDDVSDLYASACKFADTKDRWSASYVAFCNETGIVAGRNASTFDPRGKVTGLETAKMLLCLIGFDATAQGYVGSNWKTNVLRDAKAIGLLDGFAADYDISKAITREEAAQMMLNALEAPMVVGTISDNIVKVTNNVWVTLVEDLNGELKVGYTMSLKDAANWYGCYVLYGNVVVSPIAVWKNYTGLSMTENDHDCYGNPVTTWTYTNKYGKDVWSASYEHPYDARYTEQTDLKAELSQVPNSATVELYIDGIEQNVTRANLGDAVKANTGKGVETKVFFQTRVVVKNDNTAEFVTNVLVTIKNTFIGEVFGVSNLQGTFKVLRNDYAYDNTEYGFKNGDIILFWLCSNDGKNQNQLHDAKLANVVTGAATRTVSSADLAKASVKLDGKDTYEYAMNFGNKFVGNYYVDENRVAMGQAQVDASKNGGATYDLYLDEFGYIMGWKLHTDAPEYVYAYGVEKTGYYKDNGTNYDGRPDRIYTNDLVTFDGKYTEDVKVSDDIWNDIKLVGEEPGNAYGKGMLFRYVVNANDTAVYDDRTVDVATRPGVHRDMYLSSDGDVISTTTNLRVNGTASTQYMVRTWNYEAEKYEYNVYTRDQLTVGLQGYVYNDLGAEMATIQYFSKEVAGVDQLTYVFIDALYQRTAQKAMVYAETDTEISDSLFVNQIGSYIPFKAVINGEQAILAVTHDPGAIINNLPHVYEGKLQVIGLLDDRTPVYTDVDWLNPSDTGTRLWYSDGNVIAENKTSFEVAEGATIVVADEATKKYEALAKVEDLNKYFEGAIAGNDVPNYDDNNYYRYVKYWLFNDGSLVDPDVARGGEVDEIYIVVNSTQGGVVVEHK